MEKAGRMIWAVFPAAVYFLLHASAAFLLEDMTGSLAGEGIRTVLAGGVCLCFFLIWMRLSQREERAVTFRSAGFGILSLLAGAALSWGFGRIMTFAGVYDHFSNELQEQLLQMPFSVQVIGLGLVIPAAEEIAYRGMCYSRMRQTFSAVVSALTVSAVFAVSHGNMIQILYAFPMSLILCSVYEKGNCIWYPVLMHMGANLITVILGMR